MDDGISVTLPVIRKAIFTLDIENVNEFFKILNYALTETINRCDEINEIDDEVDVFMKEQKIELFKEQIVFMFVQMMLYSDYSFCQDLRGFFDHLEMMVEHELLVDGVEEVDLNSEDFEMPTNASAILHFLYYFLNSTTHEDHIRISQIFKDINIVDELGLEINLEDLVIKLSPEQIHLLTTVDIQ